MATLLLRLSAPLQAWGSNSKFNIRTTEREPTKSGVIGMIAAALGIQRNNDEGKLEPLAKLKFGVRVEREGKLLKDFHMVHEPKTGKSEPQSHVTTRYYLSDAVFLAALESDDMQLLEKIRDAVLNPIYPMYLGRRSCPVTLPVFLRISEKNLLDSLREEESLIDDKCNSKRIIYEVFANGVIVRDLPITYSQLHRQHGFRMKKEEIIYYEDLSEHDPFGQLEVDE